MAIHQPVKDLYLVDLDQTLEGFRNFISAWVLRRAGITLVVDPGPRATIPVLLAALSSLGVERIDAVLLTHIHIDHAGGAGLLLARFPEARVICHPKGIPHMIDPARLWDGSRKVLGRVADAYGEIAPIAESNIDYQDAFTVGPLQIEVLETPGHAAHHLCYRIDDLLFAGEVSGVHLRVGSGTYIRQATPPVFVYDVYRSSIEKVADLEVGHACFGHYGHTREARRVFHAALEQLERWRTVMEKHLGAGSDPLEEAVFDELLATDPLLVLYGQLPEDVQKRERYFFSNSVNGMRAHLESR